MKNLFSRALFGLCALALLPTGAAQAQIFAPEGVNMPGTWNGYAQPGSQPFGGIQATAGSPDRRFLVQTTLPTRRYSGVINVQSSGGDITGGARTWLFTSGPGSSPPGSYFNNKWANVTVALNTVQTYTLGGGTDNTVTLANGRYYTVNFKDNGYANTQAVWLETTSVPVDVSNVTLSPSVVTTGSGATVTATLSASLPADQYVYLRYATNTGFSTNENVVAMTGSGTTYSATIPAAYNTSGRVVRYYVLTSNQATAAAVTANTDLFTLKFNNNNTTGGYSYTVVDNVTQAGATVWSNPASWASGMVPPSGANVTVAHNLTLDQNATVSSLTVSAGTFTMWDGTNRNLTVNNSGAITIAGGATLQQLSSAMSLGTNLTLTNNGTYTVGTGGVTWQAGAQFVNNGSYSSANGSIFFEGTGAISGSQNLTLNNVRLKGGVNFGSATTTTIAGTLTIGVGGFVDTNAPVYATNSYLEYANGSTAGSPYGRGQEWSATSGKGYPYNISVINNTFVDLGNGGTGTLRQAAGSLTISPGSGLFMDFSTNDMTQPLVVMGNVNVNGSLSLSDALGGDLKLSGNFSRGSGGTFTPKDRAVFFDGSSTQTITGPTGGSVDFDYIVINNTSLTGVRLNSNVNANATTSSALQLNGNLDLNGNTFQLPNGVTLTVQNAQRTISSTTGTGQLTLRRNNTVTQTGGGTLLINSSVKVVTGGAGIGPINFGGLTTINGILELQAGGFVDGASGNGPIYGTSSTLRYNTGGGYDRRSEWDGSTTSRTPVNVEVTGSTYLNLNVTGSSTGPINLRGDLDISSGSAVDANIGTDPFVVQGNVINAGTLSLSTNPVGGGDLKLGGNFINTGTFTANGRAVFFINNNPQTVSSSTALAITYVVMEKGGGQVNLLSNLTVAAPAGGTALEFRGVGPNIFNLNGQTLTLGTALLTSNAGTISANSGYTDNGSGSLVILGDGDFGSLRFVSGTTLGSLTLSRTGTNAGATLLSNLGIATSLTFQNASKLILGANTLTLGSAATITGAGTGNYVVTDGTGQLAKQGLGAGGTTTDFVFPVGTASSYNPATLANSGTLDTYRVRVSATSAYTPPYPDRQIARFWTINEASAGGSNASLTLQWNPSEEGANFIRGVAGGPYFTKNNGSGYELMASTSSQVSSAPYSTTTTGITSFSEWSVGNPNVLPLRLTAFAGQLVGTDAYLIWRTAWERETARFDVERSLDGQRFERVGEVPAAGITTGERHYDFTDRQIVKLGVEVVYYRLRMVDVNGNATNSATVPLTLRRAAVGDPSLYPNPADGAEITLSYPAATATTLSLTLVDARGAIVLRTAVAVAKGMNEVSLGALPGFSSLAPGAYSLRVAEPGAAPRWLRLLRQ